MSKVYCSNCGAEVKLPEKSAQVTGVTISEESKGNYILPTKENESMRLRDKRGRFVSQVTENNKTNNSDKGENNMNNFSMEELVKTVAIVMEQMNNKPVAATETKRTQEDCKQSFTEDYWAKNSKFYGKVMADGHIYNPYLDRRFLPAQYLNMIKDEWNYSAYTAINRNYGYMYSIEWVRKEVNKLAFLGKTDLVAFEERGSFLKPLDVSYIMSNYVNDLKEEIDKKISLRDYKVKKDNKVFLKFHGYKEIYAGKEIETIKNHKVVVEVEVSDELIALIKRFENMVEELVALNWYEDSNAYKEMNNILQGIRFIELHYNTKKSSVFIDRFMAQGAFYTMRNLVLFEGYTLKGKSNRDAEEVLRENIDIEGYKLHAMLKECLKDNGNPDFLD